MSEMVERVARAMAEGAGFCWENCAQSQWRDDAKNAIEAMREPTPDMMKAVWEARFDDTYNGSQAPAAHAMCVAMIDAALKPKEGA